MDEIEFIESIDACFPYRNEQKWRELVRLGAQISDNASFMVLLEICSAPRDIPPDDQRQMLEAWDSAYLHPLKEEMLAIGKAVIADQPLPVDKVIATMETIGTYPGLYNALNLAHSACDDPTGTVDAVHKRIIATWQTKG